MKKIIKEYQKGVGYLQDWVQLPTPEERKQWEKENTKLEWVVKTKMIVTPTRRARREYNDTTAKN